MAELLQGKQHEVQLPQEEQLMEEWTQGEQQKTELLQRKQHEVQQLQEEQLMEELLQGEQPVVPLNRKVPLNGEVPLNGALEGPLKEGERACLPLYLDHPPSCNNSTEILAHPLGGKGAQAALTSIPHPRRHPPPPSQEIPAHPLSQRENQVKEGEGARFYLYLDHPPSCNNSMEIPAHPIGGKGAQAALTSIPHPRRHPPSPSQEIPAHPPGGQLA
jgi:hypothetical protein